MSMYLSEELLKISLKGFKELAGPGKVKQGATQNISAIRHCMALDRLLNKNSISSVRLRHKTDPYLEEFTKYVGDIIKLDEAGNYTTNLVDDVKTREDYGIGSNLISAGVATHSLAEPQRYPKKSNKGLMLIDQYSFSLLENYIDILVEEYHIKKARFAFLIWLNRFNSFDAGIGSPVQLFNELKNNIENEYSDDLFNLLSFSDDNDFIKCVENVKNLLTEEPVNLKKLFSNEGFKVGMSSTDNNFINIINLPKPFLLLAGISGTGKTRFVRQQAQASGSLKENYCLVPVRPDWHEPSDLLGYISRLGTKGAEYVATDVTQFIAKAWRALFDAGLAFEEQENRLVLSGNGDDLKHIKPYWLCLDEMNLAPVEQYFADYLSVLETREWVWDGDNFQYSSDPLLSPVTFEQLDNDNQEALRQTLGLQNGDYDDLWGYITEHGLGIPLNLIVAGTVNMDETTHGFSRKVIDRALSFDFGEFFPNEFAQFFEPQTQVKTLTFPIWSQASKAHLSSVQADADGAKTMTFLSDVNAILKGSPFELAYRALNELLLSVVAFSPNDEAELQAVWDDFLMCKVLPRIEGDLDKLQGEEGILHKLERLLETSLGEIWIGTSRLDLYRETINDGTELNVECRSKKKLAWMKERLASASFTSFWP